MNHVYYIELMEILYWTLGYIGGGLLFMFLTPLLMWSIDRYEVGAETFFEKSTYSTKWDYVYSDFPQAVIVLFWPAFVLITLVFLCKDLPKIINYLFYGKRQRYIDYINEKAAKIMGE